MATTTTPNALGGLSRFLGNFRWAFMPLGLFALIALGVHAAADVVDDRLLRGVEWLDALLDTLLAKSEHTAAWVNRIDSRERTQLARGLALAWELAVDFFLAVPALGYAEVDPTEKKFSFARETWRTLFHRLNQQPTPMRLTRPLLTLAFALAGAYGVSRLVESTLFVALVGDVATPDVAGPVSRVFAGTAMTILVFSHCWRATLRALQHADETCVKASRPWLAGLWGSALAVPLVVALLLESEALLSFFR